MSTTRRSFIGVVGGTVAELVAPSRPDDKGSTASYVVRSDEYHLMYGPQKRVPVRRGWDGPIVGWVTKWSLRPPDYRLIAEIYWDCDYRPNITGVGAKFSDKIRPPVVNGEPAQIVFLGWVSKDVGVHGWGSLGGDRRGITLDIKTGSAA